ncbi:hypothetical protein AB0P12_25045 [Streptomyces subrutilus]|uniref:hypothetical protein n=1 Tax=Streptomyces subrutilus TaxID=36818 RepID=UPI002E13F0C1|nr:hypothetical protein OG479_16410 [Streptomyces subrutilus]
MPGPAARLAALLWALLIVSVPAPAAWARPVGTADGPGDVALAIGLTGTASAVTGLWLRSRYRRDGGEPGSRGSEGGDP